MKYYEVKKYTISETTKVQRERISNDALSISMLDAKRPTDETMELVQSYIDGKEEISNILKNLLNIKDQKLMDGLSPLEIRSI